MLLLGSLAGCGGETFVEYRGTVAAGSQAGHRFERAPNPAGLPPVAGATVRLLVCSGTCRGNEPAAVAVSARDGSWGPLELTFGAGLRRHQVRLDVSAPGYAPFGYRTTYETTADPTAGERYLNVTLLETG